jgi:hypothetical protein
VLTARRSVRFAAIYVYISRFPTFVYTGLPFRPVIYISPFHRVFIYSHRALDRSVMRDAGPFDLLTRI